MTAGGEYFCSIATTRQLLEPADVGLQAVDEREIGQRRASPEPHRLAQPYRPSGGLSSGDQRLPVANQPLEHRQVKLIAGELQGIAARAGLKHRVPATGQQIAPQTRDRDPQRVRRARSAALTKQPIEQLLGPQQLIRAQQKQRQQSALALAAEPDRRATAGHLKRAQHAKP
ncbi:MAG TPA: hypothetical protein VEF89_02600 [Solirubrobacteraceae bacterium]|nr:hypothetical protein [Solirubrobacteraceae bacterium]